MQNISEIDKNFKLETSIERERIEFHRVTEAPFRLFGVYHEDGFFRRMPDNVAAATSDGVHVLSTNTAGGRVRFVTNSPYVILKTDLYHLSPMPHMPLTGSAGFDLYERVGTRENYVKTFMPPLGATVYEGVVDFDEVRERVFTLNFPLYNSVKELFIGIKAGSTLTAAPDYTVSVPLVFYGSSITQGGCASRPGNSYQAIISRRYDADYVNLGFSGSAKGEPAIREYIAGLSMSAFILDYDFNAPTNEDLAATHYPLYRAVRDAHPNIPIIMATRPAFFMNRPLELRNGIVRETYERARAAGDERVWFISSRELMLLCEDNGTVDGCHPNDLGFRSMAEAFIKPLDLSFKPLA